MNKYVVYWVYKSKPTFLQTSCYSSRTSIGAILMFRKLCKPTMKYIGVAKIKKRKEKKQ